MNIKLINQQIKDLQELLKSRKLSEAERESYYDTLTFLLDSRALILTQAMKEENN